MVLTRKTKKMKKLENYRNASMIIALTAVQSFEKLRLM